MADKRQTKEERDRLKAGLDNDQFVAELEPKRPANEQADSQTLDILLGKAEVETPVGLAGGVTGQQQGKPTNSLRNIQTPPKLLAKAVAQNTPGLAGKQPTGGPTEAQARKLRWEAFKDTMAPDREITPEPEIDINKAFREGDIKSIQQWWEQGQTKPEEIKRREKRDRLIASIGDGLAAISNLVTASHGAPSAFDASKGVRAGVEEGIKRYDMDFAKDAGLRYKAKEKAAATFQALENRRIATENAIRAQEAAAELRAMELAARHAEGEANRANAKELAGIRNKGAEARQKNAQNFKLFYSTGGKDSKMPFVYDGETYMIPVKAIQNEVTIGRLFNLIPKEEREKIKGAAQIDRFGQTVGHKPLTTDEMASAVGKYIDSVPEIAKEIIYLSGAKHPKKTTRDWSEYSDGGGSGEQYQKYRRQ